MPSFANIISRAGDVANGAVDPTYGAQLHRQRFEAGQQSQRLGHMSKQELADRMSQNAEYYGGIGSPIGRQMHSDAAAVLALPDDGNLYANLAKYEAKHAANVQKGEALLAQNHAGNGPGGFGTAGITPVETAPNYLNSNPFARMLATPQPGQSAAPPAAQPPTNPLTSAPVAPAPGGAASAPAAFQSPASDSGASAPVQPVPAVSPDTAIPPAAVAPAAASVPPLQLPPGLQASLDEFNSTGYMDPIVRAMIPGQATLATGVQKLPLVQKILDEMGPMTDANGLPDMGKLMRAEAQLSALGISGQNMAPMLLQMLKPRSEAGSQTWASLRPEEQELYAKQHPGEDLSQMDPNTPFRVDLNPYTQTPTSVRRQSISSQLKQFAEGAFVMDPRTGRFIPALGPNGLPLTPIAMQPREGVMAVNMPDGSQKLVAIETGKKLVTSGQAQLAPNSVANAQPDVIRAMQNAVPPVTPSAPAGGVPPVTPPAGPTKNPARSGTPASSGASSRFSAVTGAGMGSTVGGKNLPPEAKLQLQNGVMAASHLLYGDPDNPQIRPLTSYAYLADDPGAQKRISTYLNLALKYENVNGDTGVGGSLGPVSVSSGGIGDLISNLTGLRKKEAEADAATMRNALDDIERNHPDEMGYINTIMALFPALTGFRRINSGSAFRWSQTAMERELPLVGIGTNSSRTFLEKTKLLGNDATTGLANARQYWPDMDPRMVALIKSNGGTSIAAVPNAPLAIQLKDGRTLYPHDKAAADAFRRDHPELIK